MGAKHFLSALLCVALLLTPFATTVLAADGSQGGLTQSESAVSVEAVSGNASAEGATTQSAAGQSADHSGIGWWIMLAAVVCIAAVLLIFRKKIFKKLPRFFSIIIIVVLAIALILPAAALAFPQAADTVFGSGEMCTVSFETNGGSDAAAVEVASGEKLTELPTPMKTDYSFTGWYTDAELSTPFYSDASITSNTTLFASYTPTEANATIYEDPDKYVEDCDPNYTFSIVSPVELTAENLSAYVVITVYIGQLPELNVPKAEAYIPFLPQRPIRQGAITTLS